MVISEMSRGALVAKLAETRDRRWRLARLLSELRFVSQRSENQP